MSSSWRASIARADIQSVATLLPPYPPLQHQASIPVSRWPIYLRTRKQQLRQFCSVDSHNSENDPLDSISSSTECKGSAGKDEGPQRGAFTPNEVLGRLKRYGIAGILSYGLLNTAYYLTTFLVVWFYVSPAPSRMGYLAAVERFVKIMAMVWAGSQVTKLLRAGGALALAPLVDRALSWFTLKFKFETQGKAFMAIAGFCFLLAFMLFLLVTLFCA